MFLFLHRALLLLTEAAYPLHTLGLWDCGLLNAPAVNGDGSSVLASGAERKGAKPEAPAQVMLSDFPWLLAFVCLVSSWTIVYIRTVDFYELPD